MSKPTDFPVNDDFPQKIGPHYGHVWLMGYSSNTSYNSSFITEEKYKRYIPSESFLIFSSFVSLR